MNKKLISIVACIAVIGLFAALIAMAPSRSGQYKFLKAMSETRVGIRYPPKAHSLPRDYETRYFHLECDAKAFENQVRSELAERGFPPPIVTGSGEMSWRQGDVVVELLKGRFEAITTPKSFGTLIRREPGWATITITRPQPLIERMKRWF